MSTDPPRPESDRATETQHRYRALTLRSDGHILNVVPFSAYGDDPALAIARGMVDGHAIEFWDGTRLIEGLAPADG